MRIPGNKLRHLHRFFHTELKAIYPEQEADAMFFTAATHFLGWSRTQLHLRMEDNINQSDLLNLYDCAKDLAKGKPLQYILGEAWFYGLKFSVNEHVLIPRPETEELTEIMITENPAALSILDIGTGSGCIAISLKKNLPHCKVSACDLSEEALETANANAAINHCEVHFFKTDILSDEALQENYDVIVSNPPYILETEKKGMSEVVLSNEPHSALFVKGNDPILFYRKITDLCSRHLSPGGKLYFELNPLTAADVQSYCDKSGLFESTKLIKDMSGNTRFFKAIKKR
jgi:release factor glutamine methyltransferase